MPNRQRPPATRSGTTRKYTLGSVTLYITVNRNHEGRPCEVFAKADEGWQGHADGICVCASLALQHGCAADTIAQKLRHRAYSPSGGPGHPKSISDAVGMALTETGGTVTQEAG